MRKFDYYFSSTLLGRAKFDERGMQPAGNTNGVPAPDSCGKAISCSRVTIVLKRSNIDLLLPEFLSTVLRIANSFRGATPPTIDNSVVIFESQVTIGEMSVPSTFRDSVEPSGP